MATKNYRYVDADQHLYEKEDAYSRHLESKFKERTITLGPGNNPEARRWYFDGTPFQPDHNERIASPGVWKKVFAHTGEGTYGNDYPVLHPHKEKSAVTDRDLRLKWMDEENIEATVLIPTATCDGLHDCGDMPLFYAHMRSYNRYLQDDWGYRHQNRIFATPQLTLDDLDLAIEELDRLIKEDVKFVCIPPRNAAQRSPADPYFDPFWARIVEANVIPMTHIATSCPHWEYASAWSEPVSVYPVTDDGKPLLTGFQSLIAYFDRPAMDFFGALVLHNLFGRFPKLQFMSVELGIGWVPYLLEHMDKSYRMSYDANWLGGRPTELPSEIFKQHIYVTPFLGDPIVKVMETLGPNRVMLGSDFPHPEGVVELDDYLDQLADQPDDRVRSFMRDTAAELYGLET